MFALETNPGPAGRPELKKSAVDVKQHLVRLLGGALRLRTTFSRENARPRRPRGASLPGGRQMSPHPGPWSKKAPVDVKQIFVRLLGWLFASGHAPSP